MHTIPRDSPFDKGIQKMVSHFEAEDFYDDYINRFPTFHNKRYRFSAEYLGDHPLIAAFNSLLYLTAPRFDGEKPGGIITDFKHLHPTTDDLSRLLTKMNWYPYPSFLFQAEPNDYELTPTDKLELDYILEHDIFHTEWKPVSHSLNIRSSTGAPFLFKDPPLKSAMALYMLEILSKVVGPTMTDFFEGKLSYEAAINYIRDNANIISTATIGLRGMSEKVSKMNRRLTGSMEGNVYANTAFTDQAGMAWMHQTEKYIKATAKSKMTPTEMDEVLTVIRTLFHKCRDRGPANIGMLNMALVSIVYAFTDNMINTGEDEYRAGDMDDKIKYLCPTSLDYNSLDTKKVRTWKTDFVSMEMVMPSSPFRYTIEAFDAHLPSHLRGVYFSTACLNVICPTPTLSDRKKYGTPVIVKDMCHPDANDEPHEFGNPSGWVGTNLINAVDNKWGTFRLIAKAMSNVGKPITTLDLLKHKEDFREHYGWLFSGDDGLSMCDETQFNVVDEVLRLLEAGHKDLGFEMSGSNAAEILQRQLIQQNGTLRFVEKMAGYYKADVAEKSYGMTLTDPSPNPNVGLYARRIVYKNNPVAEEHYDNEDAVSKQIFGKTRLQHNVLTEDEKLILANASRDTPEAYNLAMILANDRLVYYDEHAREILERIDDDLYNLLFLNFPSEHLIDAANGKFIYNGPRIADFAKERYVKATQYRERTLAEWTKKFIAPYAREETLYA